MVVLFRGSPHPLKVVNLEASGVSMESVLSGPPQSHKETDNQCDNTFTCYNLRTTTEILMTKIEHLRFALMLTVMAKQKSSLILNVRSQMAKKFSMEAKVDPEVDMNCMSLNNFRKLFLQFYKPGGMPKETTL